VLNMEAMVAVIGRRPALHTAYETGYGNGRAGSLLHELHPANYILLGGLRADHEAETATLAWAGLRICTADQGQADGHRKSRWMALDEIRRTAH